MKKQNQPEAKTLRQKAEELLNARGGVACNVSTEAEMQKLIHEMEVHRIELEMQNEELVQAREQAKNTAEQYANLYDFAPSGYFTLSRKGEILQLNLCGAKMLCKERSRLKESLFQFFVSTDTKPLFLHLLEKVYSSGKNESCELTLWANADMPIYVLVTGIVSEDGLNCFLTVIDITERRQAEDKLRASNKFNQLLLKTIPLGMDIVDEKGNILFLSEGLKQHFGADAMDKKCWELYRDDKTQCNDCPLHTGVKNGETKIKQVHGVLGGKVFEIYHTGMIYKGKEALLKIFIDISERKQAEKALQESEEKYHAIFNNNQDIFYQTNLVGTVLEVSPSIENIFGFSRDEIIGKPFAELSFDFKSRDMFFYKLEEKGAIGDYELRLKTKTGEFKYTSINARLIFDSDGKPNHINGAIRDITERKLVEIELRESQLMLKSSIESPKDMIILSIDKQYKYLYFNTFHKNVMFAAYGKNVELGMNLLDCINNDDDIIKAKTNYNRAFNGESHTTIEEYGELNRYYYETRFNPIINDKNEVIGATAFSANITERKLAEKHIQRLNRVYTVLSNINKTIIRVRNKQLLFEEACRIAVENGGFKMAWIGMVNSTTNKIDVAASSGETGEFLNIINIDLNNKLLSSGPAGLAIRSGKCNFSNNIETDYRTKHWHKTALEYGFRSVIALPIIVFGKTYGVYMLYSGEIGFFNEDEIKLLDELANDISFALEFIENEKERRLTEGALLESEEKYHAIFNNVQDIFYQTDLAGTVLEVSPSINQFSGFNRDEIIGKPVTNLYYDPNDRVALLDLLLKNGEFKDYELRIKSLTGEIKFTSINARLVFGPDGKPNHIDGAIRDITERKKSEEALLKLKTAIEKSEVSVVITNKNGVIEYANPFFTQLTGFSPDDYIGNTPRMLKSEYHPKAFYEDMWNTILSGKTWEGEFYNRKKNGEMYWENAIISPVENSNKEITHFVAIKTDITNAKIISNELIVAKEHAEESDRLKSAFLANMSHEIRTPLNGILGFTELLKEPDLTGDQQKYYISIIEKSGARLLNIINDVIDISKIESGLVQPIFSEINVNEYLESVHSFFNLEAEDRKIKLVCKTGLPPGEDVLKTDSEKFYAILTNLVKNALKYTDTGSIEFGYDRVVATSPQPHNSYLQFYVKDTGIGIPKDRHEAIFERFIQADIANKMARQGAGLGLSISKAYVEMLNGKIWVESEEENLPAGKLGGSTFYFALPYFSKPAAESKTGIEILGPGKEIQVSPKISGLKILIAEDDEASGEFISIGVRKFGGQIINVQNGTEAVEACRANPDIDLILMDIQMPEMNGYEATRQIRQFNTKVIIIAITAFALAGDREKTIEAGCNDYMAKPIQRLELAELVQKYFKE